jgi:hypothetical protein
MGRHADFCRPATRSTTRFARTGVDPEVREPLMQAYWALDAYPGVPDVLRQRRRSQDGDLSNGEPRMLAAGPAVPDRRCSTSSFGRWSGFAASRSISWRSIGWGAGRRSPPVVERLT